jgi:cytochrome c1
MKRHHSMVAVLAASLTAALWLAGCGGPSGSGEERAAGSGAPAATGTTGASQYDSGPRAGAQPAAAALAAQGEQLFQTKGCSACHAFGRKVTGPDLAGVSMRRTEVWIENQILHPDVMVKNDPIARELFAKHALQMPNQGLSAAEAKAVIEFFKQHDQKAGLQPAAAQ